MIDWQKYDPTDRSIESHVPHLVTDGINVRVGFHASTPNGYKWFRENPKSPIDELLRMPVTHFAPINLPREEET